MDKNKVEYEINLVDMFWEICMKWKQILVWTVIFAVLAAGLSYVRSANAINASSKQNKQEQISLESMELTALEKSNVDVFLEYQNLHDRQVEYTTQSLYMQLNANAFYKGTISYYVDNHFLVEYPQISKQNNIGALLTAYENLFIEDDFIAECGKILEVEDAKASYVTELLKCAADRTEGTFVVEVLADDEEKCQAIVALIEEAVKNKSAEMTRQIGEHDVELLNKTVALVYDDFMLDEQKNEKERLFSYASNLETLESKLTEKEKQYIEVYRNQKIAENAPEEPENDVVQKPTVSKKIALLGMIFGAFLAVVLYLVKYIFNNKLRVEDAFERIFGVKVLGIVEKEYAGKNFGLPIRKFLVRKRRASQRIFYKDEALELIAVSVKVMAKKMGYAKVYLTGAAMNGSVDDRVTELKKLLEKMDVELIVGSSVLYHADAFEDMTETGAVVLWEKAGESMYAEIEEEIQKCRNHKTDILGAVVAE